MKIVLAITVVFFIGGCFPYPIYKTLQPFSEVKVFDPNNNPIEDVEVSLISYSYPYGFEKNRKTKTTNSSGIATFESKKEWRIEAFMLHGAEIFFWNWCVYKQGFETLLTPSSKIEKFDSKPIFILNPGEASKCQDGLTINMP